jgi:glycosyltransferase involved in cell wall biosynthesis
LQIILSDDCSPDRTFEIMQEMATAYRGPHKVCLNRNVVNKHIGGHVNEIMKLAEGALLIVAAGDDVSAPHRVERNFEVWDAAGRPEYCSIFSAVEQWRPGGESQFTAAKRALRGAYSPYLFDDDLAYEGSGHAWAKNTFKLFGDFPAGLVNEDTALIVRNTVAGSILTIDEPLVRHRLHIANTGTAGLGEDTSADAVRQYYLTFLKRRELVARCFRQDFETAKAKNLPNLERFGAKRFRYATHTLAKEEKLCAVGQKLIEGRFFGRALLLIKCLSGTNATARFLRHSWLQVLSPHLYVTLRRLLRK